MNVDMSKKILLSATSQTHASNLSRTQIESLGLMVVQKLNFIPGVTDLRDIISKLNGNVIYKDLSKKSNQTGYSMEVVAKNNFFIYASNASSSLRDNYIFAHEIAHYILHSNFGEKPAKFKRYGDDLLEWEANWFAASFLMPKDKFEEISLGYKGSVLKTAAYFNITEIAVKMRQKRLGL